MELKGKKALVIGAGKSGMAAARFLVSRGADVVLNDSADLSERSDLRSEGIMLAGGGHPMSLFDGPDIVVVSPGVPTGEGEVKEGLSAAIRGGADVISEIELASRFTRTPVIAVAGTNGKSTTTLLIGHILSASGKRVFAGGNLGTPFCQYLIDGDDADFIVLEVSSFQLERTAAFRPMVSVMLNITADHLDRYSSMEEYVGAKKRLFLNQSREQFAVVNVEDEIVASLVSDIVATVIPFGIKKRHEGGMSFESGKIVSDIKGHGCRINRANLHLRGSHNTENLMAAAAVALLCGMTGKEIEKALAGFEGLPHRMEFVTEIEGIFFYDDSKATNVGALMKSIEGMDAKVVLIAGGRDKKGGYGQLKSLVKQKLRHLVLIGEAARAMGEVLGSETGTEYAGSMEEAVYKAWKAAKTGDVVMLSPACSSFDMFKDYAHRGDCFKKAVMMIAGAEEKRLKGAGNAL